MTFPFSTVIKPHNSLHLILVSHHPDDVITSSSSSYLDIYLNDDFAQPLAEQVLQLINNIKPTTVNCTRLITAI